MADQGGTDRDQVGQVVLDEGRRHRRLGAARAMGRLFGYVGSGRAALLAVLLALLAYTATLVAIPWMVKLMVDGYVVGPEVDLSGMTPLVLALGAVILVHYAADSFYHRRVVLLGQEALLRLRVDLFDHMMRLPMAFYDRNQVGRVMSRVQNDVQQLQELLNVSVFSLASVVSLAAVAGAMVVMDPQLGSVTLLSLLLVVPPGSGVAEVGPPAVSAGEGDGRRRKLQAPGGPLGGAGGAEPQPGESQHPRLR